MTGPVYVKNAVDTWTSQASPTKVMKQTTRFALETESGLGKWAWIYFTLPFPRGAKIISATLNLYNDTVFGSSHTLTVRRAAAKWSVNKITWNNQPGVTGATATRTKATAAFLSKWDIDVTALMQEVSNGAAWYGFRVAEGSTALTKWVASEASGGSYRPTLVITWSMAPDKPDTLSPASSLAVTNQFPLFTYDFSDPSGEGDLAAHQIQISSSEAELLANTPDWDSGEVATVIPQYDTSSGSWPGILVDEIRWWRVRVKDAAGDWSLWSDPVDFTRKALGAVDITSADITEGSPSISFTYTGGGTPTAYRMLVEKVSDPDVVIYDSGMQDWDTSHNIPFGIIDDPDDDYEITVFVWDNLLRVSTPGFPAYASITETKAVAFSGASTAVTALNMTSHAFLPMATLTWNYTGTATDFQILRSADGGVTWRYIGEIEVADAFTGIGTSHQWIDTSPPSYTDLMWAVVAVQAGVQSLRVTDTGEVRRLAPFLFREAGANPVMFLNPSRSMGFNDVHGIHDPLAGASVLVTQKLGKKRGTLSGRMVGDIVDGLDAETQKNNFLLMRQRVGEMVYLAMVNETLRVNVYNFNYDIVTDPEGVTYSASCEWIEV